MHSNHWPSPIATNADYKTDSHQAPVPNSNSDVLRQRDSVWIPNNRCCHSGDDNGITSSAHTLRVDEALEGGLVRHIWAGGANLACCGQDSWVDAKAGGIYEVGQRVLVLLLMRRHLGRLYVENSNDHFPCSSDFEIILSGRTNLLKSIYRKKKRISPLIYTRLIKCPCLPGGKNTRS